MLSFEITLNQAREEIIACFQAEDGPLVPLVLSSPGMGKSAVVAQIAKDFKLKLIDLRLSQCTPEDLQGYPMRQGNKATFTPFDVFPLEEDKIPPGYNGWLLFLDELTSATKPVQAAAYKLILDRMTGSFKLHPNCFIAAAGNKMTDKAVVNQMSTALQSRLIHYELTLSKDEFLDYASKVGIDTRIQGFINFMPSRLMDFRPDHQDKTFPCPRTWEYLSRLIKGKEVSTKIAARIAGTIGQGTAVEFITFAKEYENLPLYRDILAKPDSIAVPKEASTKYATISMISDQVQSDEIDTIVNYVMRFDLELQIVFLKGLKSRHMEHLKNRTTASPNLDQYLTKMARYLS
jgi:hypothetical protein